MEKRTRTTRRQAQGGPGGPRQFLGGFALLSLVALHLVGCGRPTERAAPLAAASAGAGAPRASKTEAPAPKPTTLLATSGSAYAAMLAADDEASYLLTGSVAYRLVPGRVAEKRVLDLGISPALVRDRLLYWSRGAFRQADWGGGDPAVLASVPHQPQRVVTSGERFAWLDLAEDGRFTIRTLDGSRVRDLHTASGLVAALAMRDESIYFVEQGPSKGWRFGVVPLSGGSPRFTRMRSGRTPAMLVALGDLFYYDGPSLTVRRVSPDLEREVVLARDVICSPIAVADQVYCAQPGGLVEVGFDGVVRRALPLERPGMITAVSATATRVTCVIDVGRDELAVVTIPLTPADHAAR